MLLKFSFLRLRSQLLRSLTKIKLNKNAYAECISVFLLYVPESFTHNFTGFGDYNKGMRVDFLNFAAKP